MSVPPGPVQRLLPTAESAALIELTREIGIGAQFGGKYFCHDVRVIRLPRHGASCPVAMAVSCSADRQALAKITAEGVFLEQLEKDPAHFLPETMDEHLDDDSQGGGAIKVDLNRPMADIRAELTKYPVKTRLSLTGTLVVEVTLRLTYAIGLIAALAFLGVTTNPNGADWGTMVQENSGALILQPWGCLLPAIAIGLLTVGTGLIGDGLARASSGIDRGV